MNDRSEISEAPAFSLRDVVKTFRGREGTEVRALDRVSFDVPAGRITCVTGPTGSGKSTVLRLVAGLDRPDAGSLGPGSAPDGSIGYLTQRHTLFPWLTVQENIGLPLSIRAVPAAERRRRTSGIVSLLGLAGTDDLYPHEISGGMQQRAALGRLLASEAKLWLMDEPFNALDERTRHQLQQLLAHLVRERELTVLFVTHSIDEAVFLADRVVVLSTGPGRVLDAFAVGLSHPRDRLAPSYASAMERVRIGIETALKHS